MFTVHPGRRHWTAPTHCRGCEKSPHLLRQIKKATARRRTRTPPSSRWTTASQRRSRLRGTGGTGAIARDPIRQSSKSQMRAAFRSTNARFYSACTAPRSALVTSRCSWPCRCFCHRQRARASSSSASRRSRSRPRRSCPASACQRPSPRSGSPGPAPSADSSG
jgi:hypothetical protein